MPAGACKCFTAPEEQDGNLVAPFPTFPLGFGDTGQEVVADLHEPAALGRIRPQEGTAEQACSWMHAVP